MPRVRRVKASIKAVAMDMGRAYIHAVKTNLPKATIVFDHFHVIKLFNEKLTKFRRDLQREMEAEQKDVLKGTRWLLLKKPRNLLENRNEIDRLHEALRLNQPLATVYYMKEDLGRIWRQWDKQSAEFWLDDWVKRANASGIKMLEKFAKTLISHRDGILAYYDFHKLSTGPLEGVNNKIRTLQRMAYGFRDIEFFKLKIMGLHESRMALVG